MATSIEEQVASIGNESGQVRRRRELVKDIELKERKIVKVEMNLFKGVARVEKPPAVERVYSGNYLS